jgi:hypothetical protein
MLTLPWLTWSTTMPTEPTAPCWNDWVPMPRIWPPPPTLWPGRLLHFQRGRDPRQVGQLIDLLAFQLGLHRPR